MFRMSLGGPPSIFDVPPPMALKPRANVAVAYQISVVSLSLYTFQCDKMDHLLKAMLLRSAWRLVKEGLTPFQAQAPVALLLELVENMRLFSLPSVPHAPRQPRSAGQ
jgi:hypothetical protein